MELQEIPYADVLEKVMRLNGPIYDSFDPHTRNVIDIDELQDYPVFDDEGHEIRIYSETGQRISRILAITEEDARTAGILVKLDSIGELFANPAAEEDDESNERSVSPLVTVYPQSYFSNYGHVKAGTTISVFQEVLDQVNCAVLGMDRETLYHPQNAQLFRPIKAVSSQLYNQLSHRLARRAGTQAVQRGAQTAVMASGYSGFGQSAANSGQRLYEECTSQLPFEQHFQLLDTVFPDENTPTDLRAENVFLLDMRAIEPGNRNGRYIYRNVIKPLVEGWRQPMVWEALKPHLVALSPAVCSTERVHYMFHRIN